MINEKYLNRPFKKGRTKEECEDELTIKKIQEVKNTFINFVDKDLKTMDGSPNFTPESLLENILANKIEGDICKYLKDSSEIVNILMAIDPFKSLEKTRDNADTKYVGNKSISKNEFKKRIERNFQKMVNSTKTTNELITDFFKELFSAIKGWFIKENNQLKDPENNTTVVNANREKQPVTFDLEECSKIESFDINAVNLREILSKLESTNNLEDLKPSILQLAKHCYKKEGNNNFNETMNLLKQIVSHKLADRNIFPLESLIFDINAQYFNKKHFEKIKKDLLTYVNINLSPAQPSPSPSPAQATSPANRGFKQ